ncbi:flavodoxin family protein [Oscillibacter sp. MSJ-2]|uniref:Flavodoxin family protein n=1 Tax=Dysosmobacter acutus TaxID=2841504 RepID=A0ABS6F754_9FIRM|nr:flavodoxin family protein [Dysosmobacter acutus]MBU5626100.1 flavodoxin family protein [Dysosmobacter acutus]
MKKKVLALSTSPRRGGNSELLADAFLAGAAEAGHETEKICLYDQNIQFCRGCLACQKTKRCIIRDDVEGILEKMRRVDVLVFATPIYFYEMSGQMKTLLDRTNPLFPAEYAFRDIYLLATAADGDESAMDGAVKGLEGWISCFDRAKLSGVVRGVGVDSLGAIQTHPALLERAARMGRSL